jgi:hypothetical protein
VPIAPKSGVNKGRGAIALFPEGYGFTDAIVH